MPKKYNELPSHYAVTGQQALLKFDSADATGKSELWQIAGDSLVAIWVPPTPAWIAADIWVYAYYMNGGQGTDTNYRPLYHPDGTAYIIKVPVTSGCMIQVNPYDFIGIDAIQFQSVIVGTPGTPVTQTNSPILTLMTIGNGSF